MKKESSFDFRKELCTVHKADIRDFSASPLAGEIQLADGLQVCIGENAGQVVATAAADFVDFLETSMGLRAEVCPGAENGSNQIRVCTQEEAGADLGEYAQYRGFRVEVADTVTVCGFDERGCAQGLYHLEEQMQLRRAPILRRGTVSRKPDFSPQMVHSGYGYDDFPDAYLSRIAHAGKDAILVYVEGVNRTQVGFLDFNDLIARANCWGLDVYAYSAMVSKLHPQDEGAWEFYDSLYGALFKDCPGFKGIVFVGESIGFPSHDERAVPEVFDGEGIPHGKPLTGYWPCRDYPQWVDIVKKAIFQHKPDADIVFWSYNWGRQPEKERIELIKSLPLDISLLVTFDVHDFYTVGDVTEQISDYSIRIPGPCQYFLSEAKAAKARGMRLYAMTNTGGLTWDFGVIPYEPMPYQWARRVEGMRKMKDEYGLSGIMESHHYGFYPSFVSRFIQHCFTDRSLSYKEQLRSVLALEFGPENVDTVDKAMELWSEAICHYTPTDNDLYGAARVGPSFPFSLRFDMYPPLDPGAERHFFAYYDHTFPHEAGFDKGSPVGLKIRHEIPELEEMERLLRKGAALLQTVADPNEALQKLINLGLYIANCTRTVRNAKQWYRLVCKMRVQEERAGYLAALDEMEALLEEEAENVRATVPLVRADSRLGWEATGGYICDERRLNWKLRQLRYITDLEIATLRKQATH